MDTLELTRALMRLPSVSPRDEGCMDLIGELLGASGFSVERMPFGDVDNLWLRHGDAEPVVVFAGHTDVVPPGPREQWLTEPFEPTEIDGSLFGRGSADMKGSLAAIVKACQRFVETYQDHPGSIALLLTSDEEGAAQDGTRKVMQALKARGELFQYCIVGEPSSHARLGDTVRIGRRGSLSGILQLHGQLGHVAYPLPAENPMHAFARFVEAMTEKPIDAGNAHFPPTTFQMVHVHSDAGAPNVVPADLKCRFNFRYNTEWTRDSLAAHVEDILDALSIRYDIQWHLAGEPFITEEGRLTEAVSQAVGEETGSAPELSTSGGTSDGRYIAPYGIDVVELGPINATIHKVNEEVSIEDLLRLEKIYFRIAALLLET